MTDTTHIDKDAFEKALGVTVSAGVFASIQAAGPLLYLALQDIWKELDRSEASRDPSEREHLTNRLKAIAAKAFTQATN